MLQDYNPDATCTKYIPGRYDRIQGREKVAEKNSSVESFEICEYGIIGVPGIIVVVIFVGRADFDFSVHFIKS